MSQEQEKGAPKNYDRSSYSFTNINLLGPCNLDCFFCLGKDVTADLEGQNQLNSHFSEWINFQTYLKKTKEAEISNFYLTGFNTDPLLYRYLGELIDYLQDQEGFNVGIRTNGLGAEKKINEINRCKKSISWTLLTLDSEKAKAITGNPKISNFDKLFQAVEIPQRVATVVSRQNVDEVLDLIKFTSLYPQIKYFQVRKMATDTRYEILRDDMLAFDNLLETVSNEYAQVGEFEKAPIFNIFGMPVTFWKTIETSVNSSNYFTNGVMTGGYFIVEGYERNKDWYTQTNSNNF
jgi:molybdenum cofactor biosynthesis enzyme MoaA